MTIAAYQNQVHSVILAPGIHASAFMPLLVKEFWKNIQNIH